MQSALATLRFLSRLPVPGNCQSDVDFIHAAWFPVVGLLIGAILASIDQALRPLPWDLRNALIVFVGVALTGALHLDALMDTADGLAAPSCKSLVVTRASVHTSEGTAAGVLALSLSWLALYHLTDSVRAQWLVCAPMLGRAAVVLGYRLLKTRADAGSVTRSLAMSASCNLSTVTLIISLIVPLAMLGTSLSIPLALAVVITALFAGACRLRLGQFAGDQYGALAVVNELSLLLGAGILRSPPG
jgi:adenosylcobinamide-GDP ribazoletransferase